MELVIPTQKRSVDHDEDAILILGHAFLFPALTYSLKAFMSFIGVSMLESPISATIYLAWIIRYLVYMIKNRLAIKRFMTCELVYIVALSVSYFLFPETRSFYSEYMVYIRQILVVYIPCGAALSQIQCFDNCVSRLKKIAIFGSMVLIFSVFLGYLERWGGMLLGIQLIPFALIVYANVLIKRSIWYILLVIADFIVILSCGRQAFIMLVVGVFLLYPLYSSKKDAKTIVRNVVIGLLAVVAFIFYQEMLIAAGKFLQFLGFDSRLVDMLASGKLLDTSTRDLIYMRSIQGIEENGNSISGLFGDRAYLRPLGEWIAYPHNIYLELLLDFGKVFGTVLFALLILLMLRGFSFRGKDKKAIFVIIFLVSFVRLLVSSSFMQEGSFYIMLIFLIGSRERRKIKLLIRN